MLKLTETHIAVLQTIASSGQLNWPLGLDDVYDSAFNQLIEYGAIQTPLISCKVHKLTAVGESVLCASHTCSEGDEIGITLAEEAFAAFSKALSGLRFEAGFAAKPKDVQVHQVSSNTKPAPTELQELSTVAHQLAKIHKIDCDSPMGVMLQLGIKAEKLEKDCVILATANEKQYLKLRANEATISELGKHIAGIGTVDQSAAPANAKWKLGDTVQKKQGSSWRGKVVGFYSTKTTPIGYSVESVYEKGSVQVWPEAALAEWVLDPCQFIDDAGDLLKICGKPSVGEFGDVGYTADDLKAADPSAPTLPTEDKLDWATPATQVDDYRVSVFESNEKPDLAYKWVVRAGDVTLMSGYTKFHFEGIAAAGEFIRKYQESAKPTVEELPVKMKSSAEYAIFAESCALKGHGNRVRAGNYTVCEICRTVLF